MKNNKKSILRILLLTVFAAVILAFIFFIWAGETSAGAGFLLRSVFRLDIKNIEGRLLKNIVIKEMHFDLDGEKVDFEYIQFELKPASLLAGRVELKILKLKNIRISASPSKNKKAGTISLPRMPGIADLLNLRIDRLNIQGLSYDDNKSEPFKLNEVTCSILFKKRVLYIDKLVIDSSMGSVKGDVEAGFQSFYLNTNVVFSPALPNTGSADVKAGFSTVPGKEKLTGTLKVSLAQDKKTDLGFTAITEFEDNKISIYDIQLTEPAGKVKGKLSIDLSGPETAFLVLLKISGVRLDENTGFSGSIDLTGSLKKFSGGFELKTSGAGWRNAEITGACSGHISGVGISRVSVKLLQGSANGSLDISWLEGLSVQGELKGRGFNLAEINPDIKGLLNVELKGNMSRSKKGLLSGELLGSFPQSRFNGEALTAEIKAGFENNDINIKKINIKGKGLELNASGRLKEKLLFGLKIEDLSVVVPESTGELSVDGWMKLSEGRLSCSIAGKGINIYSNGIGIKDADLAFTLEDGFQNKINATLALTKLDLNGFSADSIVVEADGTLPAHKISARFDSPSGEAELIMSGAYNKGYVWEGKVLKLSGKDKIGPWQSSAPFVLKFGAKRIFIAPCVIKGGSSERAEIAVDILKDSPDSSLNLILKDIKLARVNQWMKDFEADGLFSGSISGKYTKKDRLEITGNAVLSNGNIAVKSPKGVPDVGLRSAVFSFNWNKEAFSGELKAELIQNGHLNAVFKLPLNLGFKPYFERKGALFLAVTGKLRDNGIVSALNPEFIRESNGEITFDIKAGGKWEAPVLRGSISLAKVNAFLPGAGIHIENLQAEGRLENDFISIDSFRAESGKGYVAGKAMIFIKNWNISGYSGSVAGEKFQAVNFPEIRIFCNPELKFEGDLKKMVLRGDILLPEVKIEGLPADKTVKPNPDVIFSGNDLNPPAPVSIALDINLRLILGDNVRINLSGISAQLGGNVVLTAVDLKHISGKGDIYIINGRYTNYGANLEIVKGRLYYTGGPITQPTLDMLALRTTGDIKAGVLIKGTVISPVMKLYSEPSMPDTDILSYMVLGRPFGKAGDDTGRVSQAAGILSSTSQFASLQDRIKSSLGLSTVEIQDYNPSNYGRMGYTLEPLTNISGLPTEEKNGQNTMVSFGKYLTPKLYFNYGKSLYTGDNRFFLRYDIFKDWQLETQTGSSSGIDLFYKIEFE